MPGNLGEVTVTGEGLCGTLRLLVPAEGQAYILPFFEQFESVRSDGNGMLYIVIKRERGVEGAHGGRGLCRCLDGGQRTGRFSGGDILQLVGFDLVENVGHAGC